MEPGLQSELFLLKKRPAPDIFFYWGISSMLMIGWIFQIVYPGLTTNAFELLFVFLSVSAYLRKSTHTRYTLTWVVIISLYTLISLLYAVFIKGVNTLDFIMAYKFTWYILLLLPFSNIKMLDKTSVYRLLKLTLIMFVLVYLIKFILGDDRPTFFIENNFEIMLLCFLFYANHVINHYSKMLDMFLLLLITVISGSRSGVVLALITVIFCTDIKQIIRTKNIFLPLAGVVGVIGAYFVFSSRTQNGLESTDRYRFYQYFLESTADWTWWQYLLGAERITKLPSHVCSQLSFYEKLLSFENNGSCYSVIFHSFNMRILYDHGIVVILILILILNNILKNRSLKEKALIFLLLFMNGLSVSSINSVYAALGVAILASIPRRSEIVLKNRDS